MKSSGKLEMVLTNIVCSPIWPILPRHHSFATAANSVKLINLLQLDFEKSNNLTANRYCEKFNKLEEGEKLTLP